MTEGGTIMNGKKKRRRRAGIGYPLRLLFIAVGIFAIALHFTANSATAQSSEHYRQKASALLSIAGAAQSESYEQSETTCGDIAPLEEGESEQYKGSGGYIPSSGDYDGDGVLDESDNCPSDHNPGQEDTDGDEVGNICDNCPHVSNPNQEDSDGDGTGDLCEFGSVSGRITADCPAESTGLLGVNVVAYELGTGDLIGSAVTDEYGYYEITSLLEGDYTATVVTPLGYSAAADEIVTTVIGGDTVTVDFPLTCVDIIADPRSIGFWKHQVGVALGGKGHAHIDAATLCDYLDLIEVHFNSNQINQVIVYDPPASGECSDKLLVAKELLNLKGKVSMTARAKQQLMALLLNVAAGYISLTEVISEDGATVSQAITFSDNLIDDPAGDHETAKTVCDEINNNRLVAAGVIPLDTENIAYKHVIASYALAQNYPNPFNPETEIGFNLPEAAMVNITVYNALGQVVDVLVDSNLPAGHHVVRWNGERLASGVYFYRLIAGEFTNTKRMVLMK